MHSGCTTVNKRYTQLGNDSLEVLFNSKQIEPKTYLRAPYSDPETMTEISKRKIEQWLQGYKYGRKEFI